MRPSLHKSNLFAVVGLTLTTLLLYSSRLHATVTLGLGNDQFTSSGNNFGNLVVPGWGKFNDGIDIGPNSESLMNWLVGGTVAFDIVQSQGSFTWRDTITNAPSARQKMSLNGSNLLSLYNTSGSVTTITLNGGNGTITTSGSVNAGSLNVSGNLSASSLSITDMVPFRHSVFGGYDETGGYAIAMSGGTAYGTDSTAMSSGYSYGTYSTAMSSGSACGTYSTAMSSGIACGTYSTAMSSGSACGTYSTAMSSGSAYGTYSTAMTGGYSDGAYSTAMTGGWTDYMADYATAMSSGSACGIYSTAMSSGSAYGTYSTAMSGGNASGANSTAMSGGTASGDISTASSSGVASGNYSLAVGYQANAISYSSASFGRYNTSWGSGSSWVETDPLLLIGNGTGTTSTLTSNALSTLKNGQTTLTNKAWKANTNAPLADPAPTTDSGGEALVVEGHARLKGKVIIEQAQGDISMGIYQ